MLIEDVPGLIDRPLTMILNFSLRKDIFCNIWKVTKVAPIFKSGCRSEADNYSTSQCIMNPSQFIIDPSQLSQCMKDPFRFTIAVSQCIIDLSLHYRLVLVNSLLVLQNFTTARKSGNVILTY